MTVPFLASMSPRERDTFDAARRLGASVEEAVELATRAEDLAASRSYEARRIAQMDGRL